ncbi:MAG: O-antigen ligase family protein, partial [Candidatus Saganbacteria bacterium]|nr:O-antigen ligase family protein [Candidatus Saganbacteria bacterium]
YGIDPYAWGGVVTWQRVIATIGQPNFLAAYVDMAFFLGLAFLLLPKEEKGFSLPAIAPFACFALCPVIFLIMIYTFEPALQNIFPAEQVDNVFGWLWYAGWAAMTACALFFAYTFRRLPPLILDCLIIVSLTLMWIAVLFTQSRGGLIGLFAAGSLFLILVNREALLSNWKKLLALSIAVVFITGLIVTGSPELSPFKRFSEEVKGKPVEVGEAKGGEGVPAGYSAAASRLETWKSATRIVADHPFFGIGPEVMKMVFPRYETELFRFKEAFHVKQDRCHNEIFDVAVTKGIISLFVYVWLLGSVFFIGFKKLRKEDIFGNLVVSGLLSAMVGYLVQNQFSFGVVAITSLFWIMIGILANEES